MQSTAHNVRAEQLEHILANATDKASASDATLAASFIRLYCDSIATEDLIEHESQNLSGAALAHWHFAQDRKANTPSVRIYNPDEKRDGWTSPHTVCEVVDDDMPFLVDSLNMVFDAHDIGVHLTIHPVIAVTRERDRTIKKVATPTRGKKAGTESFLHFEIDRQTDPDRLEQLAAEVRHVLGDIRAAVDDWPAMRRQAKGIATELESDALPLAVAEVEESAQFLKWLVSDHFTFLGYRDYDLIQNDDGDTLHIVPDSGLGILRERDPDQVSKSFETLPPEIRKQAREKKLITVTKANAMATVHRASYMDYIGVRRFDDAGHVIGERRFLGLFTSAARSISPRRTPLLRNKVKAVLRKSGLRPASHDCKALLNILENLPRDELFQNSIDELHDMATTVLAMQERQWVKLFIRPDRFGRFYSCLVYVPRERYNNRVRDHIRDILRMNLNGIHIEAAVYLSESKLACIHVVVHIKPWRFSKFNQSRIEQQIRLTVRSWEDHLRDELTTRFGEERGLQLYRRYGKHFYASYQERVRPDIAVSDVEQIDNLTDDHALRMSLFRPAVHPKNLLRLRLFKQEQPISISTALPILENLGMNVLSEQPYELDLEDGTIVSIQDFEMLHTFDMEIQPDDVKARFQDAFTRIFNGTAENDGFNRLILGAGLTCRETTLIRAYCKYLLQTGAPFSQAYMEQTLTDNTDTVQLMIELFKTRFTPAGTVQHREEKAATLDTQLQEKLDAVASLDEERILRGFISLVEATLRTNYFQLDENRQPKPYISYKLESGKIPDLPLPKPMFEIFVYSTRFEAVHLRGDKVARGGIRWSDRREDFRTEILGLMKAQMVKNTVIVPVGSKGGFVVKHPPKGGRDELMKEVIACYQNFMRGMLDVTDNLVDGSIKPPERVVRRDEDDPYLVVAADKGTASFSDIANAVAGEYDYWLGDAFASGGSAGYDHKEMGITARGGWESVKRHFRELGIDIQATDFTAVGIGDMAGDVFGNGMLLSQHTRLVAAFNHMHIFLDPNPDAETSFKGRERLYNLPRSTWEDYDAQLISQGGGVYPRSAKHIKLSDEIRTALDISADTLTPNELIRAILKAPVDMLWNGGIGTYVKAEHESSADVGDHANDTLRINGKDLRCQVVGEGGNLGFTQLGRIEYALTGGRLNTDFVDNSAGVNCSDHEVNIKILLNLAVADKTITVEERNSLLASMTAEIAELVLRTNYLHSQAISVIESQAPERIDEHAHLIQQLGREGTLDRVVEYLPGDEELIERRSQSKGLTRPELAVLVAYSKISLYHELINSDAPEDSHFSHELELYFPMPLQQSYRQYMAQHRLRRDIIVTAITNNIVDRMGPTFLRRMAEETNADASSVARAYAIACEVYGMRETWSAIESLDNKVAANIQADMIIHTTGLLRHTTRWLLAKKREKLDIAAAIAEYQPGVTILLDTIWAILPERDQTVSTEKYDHLQSANVPDKLARKIAALLPLYAGLDIVEIATVSGVEEETVARVYYRIGAHLDIDWLHEQVEGLEIQSRWQAIARGALREDLYAQQRRLSAQVLADCDNQHDAGSAVDDWLASKTNLVEPIQHDISDMKTSGHSPDFPTLTVALQEIRRLAEATKTD